jgi:hypothetical protein
MNRDLLLELFRSRKSVNPLSGRRKVKSQWKYALCTRGRIILRDLSKRTTAENSLHRDDAL